MSIEKRKKLFGTDGIRGRAGAYPLDENTLAMIGFSIVDHLQKELGRRVHLVIGRDTRESGPQIEVAITRGAIAAGARVESAGVITTPGIAYLTRTVPFDAGVVISASHNPYRDNGIKVFSPSGKKLADEMEQRIEADLYEADYQAHRMHLTNTQEKPHIAIEERTADIDRYIDYLAKEIARDLNLDGMRIAVDCANGAASAIAPELFKRLGATLEVIYASPDGININEHCGALHIQGLQELVRQGEFDFGVAFDGDADRALFVDGNGNLVDGDYTMLILAENLKSHGKLSGNAVVATVMSNIGLEIALREKGIELVRAQVGDRYVLEEMLSRGASIGGEQSGHIILSDISLAGDGIITAIAMLRAMKESGQALAELASAMRTYPQTLVNVWVKHKPPLDSLPEVKKAMDDLEKEMQGRGRVLIRYSGTENLARVMIEGEDQSDIEEKARRMAGVIEQAIG
jgi:phosphoglucosamine mutase